MEFLERLERNGTCGTNGTRWNIQAKMELMERMERNGTLEQMEFLEQVERDRTP